MPDMVAMDGVVHGIDKILVPPPVVDSDKNQDDESARSQDSRPWLFRLFDWSAADKTEQTLTVDQWIERLQPLMGELRI